LPGQFAGVLLLFVAMALPGLLVMLAFCAMVHGRTPLSPAEKARLGEASHGTAIEKREFNGKRCRGSKGELSLTYRGNDCRECEYNSEKKVGV
jgi:hypothetical protein